jgi:hypothetical protein
LQLFVQVCQAIQHAHQKGVIHRDIKPSNILVAWQDGKPAPKVIDFGIAKATEEPLTDKTVFTSQRQLIGTPAYMSPEQAEMGVDIDTRSDIYSLGVLLYELLTGKTPFDPQTLVRSGVDELRRMLREQDPPTPAAMLASLTPGELAASGARRRIEPRKLIARVRGDLDSIVMKALEKDRGRRYETANGLAMDVERHLNHEPIVALPPSRIYRFQKLVRRNQGVFAAVAAVAAVLIAGLGTSTWLLRQEILARQRAVAAEQREARLRHEAETREKIIQAAIFLNDGRMAEADRLIDGIELAPQTTEGAAVFRTLGQWHALAGRWKTAARRFDSLTRINQVESWDLATLDFLECGVCLEESGDLSAYERFHQFSQERFRGATNVVVAERVLKINLLPPVDQALVTSLRGWAKRAEEPVPVEAVETGETPAFRSAWRAISLALFDYRGADYAGAVDWCQKCLACPEYNAPRVATARVILAMALERLGRHDEARRQLAAGRELIESKTDTCLEAVTAAQGFWFDWVFGRILLREALVQFGPA